MSNCNHSHEHSHVCNVNATSGVCQSLDELEFEKGIWAAAQCGDLSRVKLLNEKGNDINKQDTAGYTALHYASRNGHLIVCQYLVSNGAYIDAITKAGAATALHRACTSGKLEIVKFLLNKKANALLRDADGKTALHRAAENKHHEIYNLLLDLSPDLKDIRDNKLKLASDYL